MKNTLTLIVIVNLVLGLGCKKETTVEEQKWNIDDDVINCVVHYNSKNQLIKFAKYINESLLEYVTYSYSDTTLVEIWYNENEEEKSHITYTLDSNNRAIKSNINDTIVYNESGFLDYIQVEENYYLNYNDNGTNIISVSFDLMNTYYHPSETLCTKNVPYDFMDPKLFTGVFGNTNQYLIKSYSKSIGGPGGGSNSYEIEHKFNSENYVIEVKKYNEYPEQDETEPILGTVSYVNYKYVFE